MFSSKERRDPYLWEALLSLLSLVVGIVMSIVVYGTDPHIPMLLGVLVSALVAYRIGYKWEAIQDGMNMRWSSSIPDWLNNYLLELKESGRYDVIYEKWFVSTDWFGDVR